RLGQVAAPAAAGLIAGVAGVAAPFVLLGALLLLSSGVALRAPRPAAAPPLGTAAHPSAHPDRPAPARLPGQEE
ncbi:MFS transporter, partial [Streptomyces sp. TRM76130]|nr:MFS transporter [Streptomyces sp. TRM76130]